MDDSSVSELFLPGSGTFMSLSIISTNFTIKLSLDHGKWSPSISFLDISSAKWFYSWEQFMCSVPFSASKKSA